MFDFDAGKLIIIGIVALIVIGPKELPRVMRQVGQAAAKMRRMAAEFRAQFMDAMRDADIDDIKADVGKLAESAKIDAVIDPLAEIKAGITSALEAADKPQPEVLQVAGASALAPPGEAGPSSNASSSPGVPESSSAAGAEMRALADALAAEMSAAAPARTPADAAKPQEQDVR